MRKIHNEMNFHCVTLVKGEYDFNILLAQTAHDVLQISSSQNCFTHFSAFNKNQRPNKGRIFLTNE
jgi:hypothetical protein